MVICHLRTIVNFMATLTVCFLIHRNGHVTNVRMTFKNSPLLTIFAFTKIQKFPIVPTIIVIVRNLFIKINAWITSSLIASNFLKEVLNAKFVELVLFPMKEDVKNRQN